MKYLENIEEFFYEKKAIIITVVLLIFFIVISNRHEYDDFDYIKETSYFVVELDDDIKYEKIRNHSNVDRMEKCLFIDDTVIMVGDEDSIDEETIRYVSEKEFEKHKYKDEYFITLKNWDLYIEMDSDLMEYNIAYALYLLKKDDPYKQEIYG